MEPIGRPGSVAFLSLNRHYHRYSGKYEKFAKYLGGGGVLEATEITRWASLSTSCPAAQSRV